MLQQLAWMLRPAMLVEVGGRCAGGVALCPRADRHGDHVLLQALVIADSRIEASPQDIDEIVLRHNLHPNLRIDGEKRRNNLWQDQPCRADRDIELEGAGWRIAKPAHPI